MLWEQLPALLLSLPGEICVGGLVGNHILPKKEGGNITHLACI